MESTRLQDVFHPLLNQESDETPTEGKGGCQKWLTSNPLSIVANVLATLMMALAKVTFKATISHPSKKLRSLADINKLHSPFGTSSPRNYIKHHHFEMDDITTTQASAPMEMTTAMVSNQAPPSPRRFTISTLPPISSRTRKNAGNGQCTHLTTTRLYTDDFRCQICLQSGSFGWLYRCTQDRELLLDEDMESGFAEKLDKFCDILPKSNTPRKRSAAARLDQLSVLTEISDEAMKSYTPEQLKIILGQRAHLLDTLSQADYPDFPESFYTQRPLPTLPPRPHPNPPPGLPVPASSSSPTNNNGMKPWFPLPGGECQFKCCHFCRPSMKDRSFLSLNGIANGDIPASSISGFGFHLSKKRPVALVKHVINLGLRENPLPAPRPRSDSFSSYHTNPSPSSSTTPSPRRRIKRRPTSLGLGIFTSETTHPAASPTFTSTSPLILPPPRTPNPTNRQPSTPIFASFTSTNPRLTRPTTPLLNSFEQESLAALSAATVAARRHSYHPVSASTQRVVTLATGTPLPPPTPTEKSFDGFTVANIPVTPHGLYRPSGLPPSMIPAQRASEQEAGTAQEETDGLTAMETGELLHHEFGSAPLDVKDGVAVSEENVELHVPDVITQF